MSSSDGYTPLNEIQSIHDSLKSNFNTGKSRDLDFRRHQLLQLARLLKENEDRLADAITQDLGRPKLESLMVETSLAYRDARDAYDDVHKWMKPSKGPLLAMHTIGMRSIIRKEPKGLVLIISPYNYPARLCLSPLVGAIAAGNAAVIKPSELSKATSALLAELFPKYLDSNFYRVINGAIPETTKLLELQWDHILYIGGARVGRIVMAAAIKYLTPLTLELGGKNPLIVDSDCDFELAARRILWGKFVNAGQTCAAPDYLLVLADAQDRLICSFRDIYRKFYPNGSLPDAFTKIISSSHFDRLNDMLKNTKGQIVLGGETDMSQRYIAPTVVRDVSPEDCLMNEEIFGPILPIVTVPTIDDAISFVNERDHPLALYIFSNNKSLVKKVLDCTQSGGVMVNDCLMQYAEKDTPIGGIGASGFGTFNGKYSFDAFTHFRTTMYSPKLFDIIAPFRFPPYRTNKLLSYSKNFLMRPLPRAASNRSSSKWAKWLIIALVLSSIVLYSKTSAYTSRGILKSIQRFLLGSTA